MTERLRFHWCRVPTGPYGDRFQALNEKIFRLIEFDASLPYEPRKVMAVITRLAV
jgi:hypothetical protein